MKKVFKKIATVLAFSLLICSLAGCGGDTEPAPVNEEPEKEVAESVEEPEETEKEDELSFEDQVAKAVSGIGERYVKEGAEDVDYLYNVFCDPSIVTGIKVDASAVKADKPGDYSVKYEVSVDREALEAYVEEYVNKDKKSESKTPAQKKEETSSADKKEKTTDDTASFELTVHVVDEKEAQELADQDIPVYCGETEIVKKSDGTEVKTEKSIPESSSAKGEEPVSASEAFGKSEKDKEESEKDKDKKDKKESDSSKKKDDAKAKEEKKNDAPKEDVSIKKEQSETPVNNGGSTGGNNSTPSAPAHEHNWVAQTQTVHHDAEYANKWIVDKAAWDEKIKVKDAWDEQVQTKAAWDEKVSEEHAFCSACNMDLTAAGVALDSHAYEHALKGEAAGHYTNFVSRTVHHDAQYKTVHHDAEYKTVHHDEVGHNESVLVKDAWDETVTTGYKCSGCGATK